MNWTKIKGSCHYCDTPIGRISLEKSDMGWEIYFVDKWITDGKSLEEAKEEAQIWLSCAYYKLKRYLDL